MGGGTPTPIPLTLFCCGCFGWNVRRKEARFDEARAFAMSCSWNHNGFPWVKGRKHSSSWNEAHGSGRIRAQTQTWRPFPNATLPLTFHIQLGYVGGDSGLNMARLEMLKPHFKFNLANLGDLNWNNTVNQGSNSPSITCEALSLGLLPNFLRSGNLISNKEPDWSVEYEFYCCVETRFYRAARENEV